LYHNQLLSAEDASIQKLYCSSLYSVSTLIRTNWDGKPSGYA
jgi:hypothetical protein